MLMALAHGPYYTFYSIYLVEHGYSKSIVGWLWAIGVICEIGRFFLMPQLMHRFRLKQIMAFSFGCAVARFLMIGWGVDWPARCIGWRKSLHAATYGAHHATAMMVVHHFFPGRHSGERAGALYQSYIRPRRYTGRLVQRLCLGMAGAGSHVYREFSRSFARIGIGDLEDACRPLDNMICPAAGC